MAEIVVEEAQVVEEDLDLNNPSKKGSVAELTVDKETAATNYKEPSLEELYDIIDVQKKAESVIPTLKTSGKIVSLQDAAHLVVLSHPRMAQVTGQAKSEAELITVAKAGYYPQIRGGLGMRYEPNSGNNQYDKDYIQSINLEINQTIYDFGRTSSAVKSAESSYMAAQAYIAATNEELIAAATSAVISIDRYEKLVSLSKAQVARVESLGKLVEARYQKGASNLSDVLQANSRIDDVRAEEMNLSYMQKSQIKSLGLLIGAPDIEGATSSDLPKELASSCTTFVEWDEIPEFLMAEFDERQALADLDRASSEEYPTISLQGSTSRPLNATPRDGRRNETRVSLNVSVPFYQGGGLSANRRASANYVESASARKAEIKLEINQALSNIHVQLQNMSHRQNLLVQRVDNLRGTKELYRQQYLELGTRTLLDLLNAEQEFYEAQVAVENNKFDITQSQLDCAFYQGQLRKYFQQLN